MHFLADGIAVAICMSKNQNPRNELQRFAPQLVFWFCVLTGLATAMLETI